MHVGASGVVRCILNRTTLGFIQYSVLGSSCVIVDAELGFETFHPSCFAGWSGRKAVWQPQHKTSQPQLPDPTTGSTAGAEQHYLQVIILQSLHFSKGLTAKLFPEMG